MKYFTKEWCYSELDDAAIENTLNNYNSYINSIYDTLPFPLKIVTKTITFHDGIIKKITFKPHDKFLSLDGIFGDLKTGYYFLNIKYLDIDDFKLNDLTSALKNQKLVILADEIEINPDGIFSHCLFFSSKREIEIKFKNIELDFRNASAKDYKIEESQYIES